MVRHGLDERACFLVAVRCTDTIRTAERPHAKPQGFASTGLLTPLNASGNLQVPLHVDTRLTTEAVKSVHHDKHGKRIDAKGHAV